MSDFHLKVFYGQSADLVVESKSKYDEFVYFHLVNKNIKENNKIDIKYTLEEIALILCVLRKDLFTWKSYYQEDMNVSFEWEDKNSQILWIHAASYSKTLYLGQIEVLKLLLTHLLDEKVIFATCKNTIDSEYSSEDLINQDNYLEFSRVETINKVEGRIVNQTDKAILINFIDNYEIWIPKSTIHSYFNPKKSSLQSFMIENWILKKNNLDHIIVPNDYSQKQ